jgi:LemA protein
MKRLLLILCVALGLTGCGYNDIQVADESTKSAWSEVLNQYQRRSDLIPNLVNTVKGYAAQEKDVFVQVTEARSRVGQIKVDPSNPESLKQFESAQRDMGSALSRLLVVSENYPQLKSDQNFRELQAQLEGTENRITVARKRYIDAIQAFNVKVRQFPVNLTAMVFGYKDKPQFAVENEREISKAPTVNSSQARSMTAISRRPESSGGPITKAHEAASCNSESSTILGTACARRAPESIGTSGISRVTSRASKISCTCVVPASPSSETFSIALPAAWPPRNASKCASVPKARSPSLRGGSQTTALPRFIGATAIPPRHGRFHAPTGSRSAIRLGRSVSPRSQ